MQYSNARYTLNLCDSFGNKVTELNTADTNQFIRFKAVRTVGSVGAVSIMFTGGSQEPAFLPLLQRFGLLRKDSIIEIWRTTGMISSLLLDTVWFVRNVSQKLSEAGVISIEITAFDTYYLLSGRICLDIASREQNQLVYTNVGISYLMNQLVEQNTISTNVLGSNRPISNMTVPFTVYDTGNTNISIDVSKANLLSMLQQLQSISIMKQEPYYFDIVASSANSLMFQVFANQRGFDRRATTSDGDGRSAILSAQNGTLRELTAVADWSEEITAVLPWGNNGATALGFITDPTYAVAAFTTPYSWREAISEGANNNANDTVQAAYGMLQNSRGTWNISATIQDSSDFRYGRDWGFGDRININVFGAILDTRINSIEISVENKAEDIRIALAVTEELI